MVNQTHDCVNLRRFFSFADSAIAGEDFTPGILELTLMPTQPTMCTTINITADNLLESREQFIIAITTAMPQRVIPDNFSITVVIEGKVTKDRNQINAPRIIGNNLARVLIRSEFHS